MLSPVRDRQAPSVRVGEPTLSTTRKTRGLPLHLWAQPRVGEKLDGEGMWALKGIWAPSPRAGAVLLTMDPLLRP